MKSIFSAIAVVLFLLSHSLLSDSQITIFPSLSLLIRLSLSFSFYVDWLFKTLSACCFSVKLTLIQVFISLLLENVLFRKKKEKKYIWSQTNARKVLLGFIENTLSILNLDNVYSSTIFVSFLCFGEGVYWNRWKGTQLLAMRHGLAFWFLTTAFITLLSTIE